MLGTFSTLLHKIVGLVSGEFLLMWPDRRANGGTMIFWRSLWVSVILYATTLALREMADPTKARDFDFSAFRTLVVQTLPWFGAFFTAAYFALYARFSSQWTYLAGLYNQIMAAMARTDHDEGVIAGWKAAFIEDAEELHLSLKPMYAAVIKNWSEEADVVERFAAEAPGGQRRLTALLKDVDRIYIQVGERWR